MKLENILNEYDLAKIVAVGLEAKAAVEEVIGRYEGRAAYAAAWRLAKIADDTKDKGAVIKVAKIMSLDEIVRTIGRYEGRAAYDVAWRFAEIADDTKDKEAVIESARAIGRYEGEAARGVAFGLAKIAGYTKDKGAVMTACRLVEMSYRYTKSGLLS